MKKNKHRMIYLADNELLAKINWLRSKHQLNVSAVIRDLLEKKYMELKNNE